MALNAPFIVGRASYINTALLGCSTLQVVLAARSGSSTHTSMQLAQLACHIYRFLLATRPMHQSSNIQLQHYPGCAGCSYWQRYLHVDTAIIGLQHSSRCAGCSQSQQHSHANAACTARLSILSFPSCKQRSHIKAAILSCGTLQVVLAARIGSGTHMSIQRN